MGIYSFRYSSSFVPINIISNQLKLDKENDFYFSLFSLKKSANNILNQLTITPSSKQSTVIDLSIDGRSTQEEEKIF